LRNQASKGSEYFNSLDQVISLLLALTTLLVHYSIFNKLFTVMYNTVVDNTAFVLLRHCAVDTHTSHLQGPQNKRAMGRFSPSACFVFDASKLAISELGVGGSG